MKKTFYRITAVLSALTMLACEGCITEGLKVEGYPDYRDLVYGDGSAGSDSVVLGEGNLYNPEILNLTFKDDVSENIQKLAVDIIKAVSEGKESIPVDIPDAKRAHVDLAYELAFYSNPIVEIAVVDFDSDKKECTISYGVDNPEERCKQFEKEINEIFAACVKVSDTDEEKAKAIYGYLINEIEYDHEYETALRSGQNVDDYFMTIDSIERKKGTYLNLFFLYGFCLNQIGIKSLFVVGGGKLTYAKSNELNNLIQNENIWMIITIGDYSYHCDTLFEAAVLYEERQKDPEANCKYQFFGMSDKTRKESFEPYYMASAIRLDPMIQKEIPECEKDIKKK